MTFAEAIAELKSLTQGKVFMAKVEFWQFEHQDEVTFYVSLCDSSIETFSGTNIEAVMRHVREHFKPPTTDAIKQMEAEKVLAGGEQ